MYLSIFSHPLCPPPISHTHARRTFDRALRTLPPSLHSRIWPRYLRWAEQKRGMTTVKIYRRYLQIDPSMTEHYTSILLAPEDPRSRRPLEAAKLLLGLARKAAKGEYSSPEGKSPYQLFGEFLDVVEANAEEVGMDLADAEAKRESETAASAAGVKEGADTAKAEPASVHGSLIRFDGPPVPVGTSAASSYDEDEDPTSSRLLDIEKIVTEDGLEVYKDQMGRLYTGLATYWTKRGEFDKVRQ